ncbi:tetratricopeptide repeat protein [Flavobacterium caeni]|uniref:SH3 domain-containing protein n=1 Tax=Flavobacterium caeni TaxID=490189 RepID=A0A1G5GYJ6_9FLAO|nr:tetratricopeptide repeat protein [Flavobacterium caeni]SCY56477.1 SH3 domain-containing protein [Flavobacterium caeni]
MKKIALILILVAQSIWSQTGFEDGNKLYEKEQYEQAATAYENVLRSGKHSAELYFNLGNAYYKQNKVASAIYNYEKALVLSPGNAEIETNLKFAQKMTIDEIKEVPKVGFEKLLRDFTGSLHYDSWAWAAVWLAFAFLGFFLGYYFSRTTLSKRIFFVGMFVLVFAILVAVLAALFEKSYYENERPAIVFAEMTVVKSEPRTTANDVFTLHEGTKVMVLERTANWDKIELLDGSEGWIETSAIKEVK